MPAIFTLSISLPGSLSLSLGFITLILYHSFLSFLVLAHAVLWWWWHCNSLLVVVTVFPFLSLFMVRTLYILPIMTDFLPFWPLIAFFWMWVVETRPPIVCHLPSHHHLPMLPMPLPITRQRKLFCLLVHRGILIHHSVGILSYYPSWHTPSGSNSSFLFLDDMSS